MFVLLFVVYVAVVVFIMCLQFAAYRNYNTGTERICSLTFETPLSSQRA